jgi:hypothetical protein
MSTRYEDLVSVTVLSPAEAAVRSDEGPGGTHRRELPAWPG